MEKVETEQPTLVPSKRIIISLEFDVIAVILLVAGILTRIYRLEEPRSIV